MDPEGFVICHHSTVYLPSAAPAALVSHDSNVAAVSGRRHESQLSQAVKVPGVGFGDQVRVCQIRV